MKKIVVRARHALRARRADKQQWSRLDRDLSMYSTPRDRLDFAGMLDRYPDQETELLRSTLARQTAQAV